MRNSDPNRDSLINNQMTYKKYAKFERPRVEYEQTPVKKSSNMNDTRHLSSVQIEISDGEARDENEHQSSNFGSGKDQAHNFGIQKEDEFPPEGRISFNTPQRTSQKLMYREFEDQNLHTQTIQYPIDQSSAKVNTSNEMKGNYSVKEYSEEKKSEARVDTDFQVNVDDYKQSSISIPEHSLSSKKASNVIDYIFGLDHILKSNKHTSQIDEEDEEDAKIENSDPFIVAKNPQQVVDRNILELNGYSEENSGQFRSSTSRASALEDNKNLEEKEGWLFKRSFNKPSVIGWQRRYCKIKNNKFLYYKDNEMRKLDGVIDFNLLTCLITVPKDSATQSLAGKC